MRGHNLFALRNKKRENYLGRILINLPYLELCNGWKQLIWANSISKLGFL